MSRESEHNFNLPLVRSRLLWFVLLWLGSLPAFASQGVTLTWNPSPDTNAVGYKIYYGSVSGIYTNTLTVGSATTVTVSGLVDGGTYYFSATALSVSGAESAFSNEAMDVIPQATNSPATTDTNTTTNPPNPPAGGSGSTSASQPPTLSPFANLTIYQNAGVQTVNLTGISAGTNGNPTVNVSAVADDNGTVISTPTVNYTSPNSTGTLTFAPVTNALGTGTVTVTVDNGAGNFTQTFTVTVVPAPVIAVTPPPPAGNQAPTLNPIANISLIQGAMSENITLTGISSGSPTERQQLRISASSNNPRLVAVQLGHYNSPASTAVLTLRPSPGGLGTATITVMVNDGGRSNNIVVQSFTVSLVANQPPTLDPITNMTVVQTAGTQAMTLTGITSGSPTENQNLRVTASSTNPRLLAQLGIQYSSPSNTAVLTFKPSPRMTGVATVTVTVSDGSRYNSTFHQRFTVTVTTPPPPTPSASVVAAAVVSAPLAEPSVVIPPQDMSATLTTVAHDQGQFSFQVTGVSGAQYVVQATPDLAHWTSIQTNTSPFVFQDRTTQGSQRFYRAVYQQP